MYLEVKDIKKSYGEGGSYIQVLKGISLSVEKGKMCVIQRFREVDAVELHRRTGYGRFRIDQD
jgi:hypothetical protein